MSSFSGESFVGTWTTIPEAKETWDKWTFHKDGSLEFRLHIESRGRIHETLTYGHYAVRGDQLTMDFDKSIAIKVVNLRQHVTPAERSTQKIWLIKSDRILVEDKQSGPTEFFRVN